ncbi:MAG: SUMF1/EgtB/PvdO family nonheme iron enzyme [Fuerstiella sp.]|nr:SUMF1/EgtB/PvdO family nonheme iron enzyme [Fuerstiella sp.]
MTRLCFSTIRTSILTFITVFTATYASASENFNIPLWEPGKVPLGQGNGPLDNPLLTVFPAPEGHRNGSSVIIAPGGSNIMLMYGSEGIEIAERFNEWGTTAFVLTYRMSPTYDHEARTLDGTRAIRVVRSRAAEWDLDPKRLMFIGFSAGSSMARYVAAASDAGNPNAPDPVDRLSSRPHSLGMIYGTGSTTPQENLAEFPATYLLSAAADGAANKSAELFIDINHAGGVAELHVLQKGRHGFGAAFSSPEFRPWMDSLKHFLTMGEFFGPLPGQKGSPNQSPQDISPRVIDDGYGELVYVPEGSFEMGDNFGDGESRERPVHTVSLDAYYIGKHEVTNARWRQFRNDPGYDNPAYWPGHRVVPKDQNPYWSQERNHGGGTSNSDNYPVQGMNWDASTAYCSWLSAQTGKRYRLPTEAEWEKAARGTDQRRFPWGNAIDHSYANIDDSQIYDTGQQVGYYDGSLRGNLQTNNGSSVYGAMDMAGNLMEWCSDWYSRDYYQTSPVHNPQGPATGGFRVLRGGCFFFEGQDARSYGRSGAWPSVQAFRMIGFRVVREP